MVPNDRAEPHLKERHLENFLYFRWPEVEHEMHAPQLSRLTLSYRQASCKEPAQLPMLHPPHQETSNLRSLIHLQASTRWKQDTDMLLMCQVTGDLDLEMHAPQLSSLTLSYGQATCREPAQLPKLRRLYQETATLRAPDLQACTSLSKLVLGLFCKVPILTAAVQSFSPEPAWLSHCIPMVLRAMRILVIRQIACLRIAFACMLACTMRIKDERQGIACRPARDTSKP